MDWLCSVAGVAEVVHSDAEDLMPFGSSVRMRASEEVSIVLEYGFAMGASVFFEGVVSVDFGASG
jgi:hypothetical protein